MKTQGVWLLVIGLILVLSGCLANADEAVGSNEEAQAIVSAEETCMDNIIVEISDLELSVPRYGTFLRLKTGEQLNRLHRMCDQDRVQNVQNIRWPHISLSDVSDASDYDTSYRRYRELIEQADKEGHIETLPDGLQKIVRGASEIYILPMEIAATGNNEPIVFFCRDREENRENFLTQRCDTDYFHSFGFHFWYSIARKNYPPFSHIQIDREKRAWLKALTD